LPSAEKPTLNQPTASYTALKSKRSPTRVQYSVSPCVSCWDFVNAFGDAEIDDDLEMVGDLELDLLREGVVLVDRVAEGDGDGDRGNSTASESIGGKGNETYALSRPNAQMTYVFAPAVMLIWAPKGSPLLAFLENHRKVCVAVCSYRMFVVPGVLWTTMVSMVSPKMSYCATGLLKLFGLQISALFTDVALPYILPDVENPTLSLSDNHIQVGDAFASFHRETNVKFLSTGAYHATLFRTAKK
jgi:hypothetical protein